MIFIKTVKGIQDYIIHILRSEKAEVSQLRDICNDNTLFSSCVVSGASGVTNVIMKNPLCS